MKRILLAGYGNIARSFEKIMCEQEDPSSYLLTKCDLKDGNDVMDYLPKHVNDFDVVINTSLANSILLSEQCAEMGIDYLDVGIEEGINSEVTPTYDYVGLMDRLTNMSTPKSRVMLGFGINPGILEHIYQKYKPAGKHYAFELEHDDAETDEYSVYGTWSPFMYVEESIFSDKMLTKQDETGTHIIDMNEHLNNIGGSINLNFHSEQRKYLPICHEELITMTQSNPDLLGSGYLFQAPRKLQYYCLKKGKKITQHEALSIPVPENLKGEDHVGMLFYDLKDNIYWIKNVMQNQTTWRRYGVNSVCWQTATGAWVGYKMMDKLDCDHPHTMTEVSQLFPKDIDQLLEQIGMVFEREDNVFDVKEFKQNVLKYFK